jgi:signal transduction histidine kinase
MLDASRFNQALVNLLSNAAKFSPPGEEVVFAVHPDEDGRVSVTVTDKGPGIPAEFREKIFGKFAQADSSSTRTQGGSGLGLNIAKSIIEAFGGEITFVTRTGKGTTFRMSFPLADAELQRIA